VEASFATCLQAVSAVSFGQRGSTLMNQKFFASFFKKEVLSFLLS
jgi:hypothetical protein